jgi:hypothetical protein
MQLDRHQTRPLWLPSSLKNGFSSATDSWYQQTKIDFDDLRTYQVAASTQSAAESDYGR